MYGLVYGLVVVWVTTLLDGAVGVTTEQRDVKLDTSSTTATTLAHKLNHHHNFYRALNFQSDIGTENEFEFASVPLAKSTSTTATASTASRGVDGDGSSRAKKLLVGGVGGFHLDDEPSFAQSSCSLIKAQFQPTSQESDESNIACTCTLSMLHSSAVKFGCEQSAVTCNDDDKDDERRNRRRQFAKVCARSVHAGTVSLERPILSTDVCLRDLTIQGEQRGDLCLSLEHKSRRNRSRNRDSSDEGNYDDFDDAGLAKCRARIGAKHCQCQVCGGGFGIRLDCSTVHPNLVSPVCDDISLVTAITGDESSIPTYLPTFMK